MYLKMMSCDAAPDHDMAKRHKIVANVTAVDFGRVADDDPAVASRPFACVTFADGSAETYHPEGNCYVLSDTGRTLSSFGFGPIPGTPCAPESAHCRAPTP